MENAGKIEKVEHKGRTIALILRNDYQRDGIEFVTPPEFSQQLAYMKHPAGKKIQEHRHQLMLRNIQYTQETLFIKRGKLRVDFFDDHNRFITSCILKTGDVILLCSGGHGFECLEETEMIEVKQGPYAGDEDKVRFKGVRE
ncbi:hypothetical protein JW877_02785 [bacterium]|nr:hypothetical protein [bacterium]